MNTVYFARVDCSVLVDAGYRWATCELETPGVVARCARVSSSAVLAASTYWAPPNDRESDWLTHQVLPAVRAFLVEHHDHRSRDLTEPTQREFGSCHPDRTY